MPRETNWKSKLAEMDRFLTGGLVPHNTALGLRAVDLGPGWVILRLPYKAELVGNLETGVMHGGAVTATLDATCGMSVYLAQEEPTRIATIDLRIDYMKPAAPGEDVLVRGECYKLTRHIAFARGLAYHADPEDLVAACAGTFMIYGDGPSPMSFADGHG